MISGCKNKLQYRHCSQVLLNRGLNNELSLVLPFSKHFSEKHLKFLTTFYIQQLLIIREDKANLRTTVIISHDFYPYIPEAEKHHNHYEAKTCRNSRTLR